ASALAALILAAGAAAPRPLSAQESPPDGVAAEVVLDPETYPRPLGHAARTLEPLRVDGVLDETAWAAAELLTGFIQSQPDAGRAATERTEVRVLYDDEHLYVGAMLHDSHAGEYVIQSLERDFPSLSTRDADIFGVALDTFLDRRNSYILLINPWGAYRDGQTFNDSRNTDFGFDAPVEVGTRRRPDGWSVEVRIPWRGLRYAGGAGPQRWGVNFLRRVRRINEDSYWAPLERRDPLHRMSKAGTLEGLEGLPEGGALQVKPYALSASTSGAAFDHRRTTGDVGADLKYGITPGLTLDATVNTDFSQVEVDQERVNLNRFPLFFEEQRDFFVENSGSFTFGDQTERSYRMGASLRDFTLFHSRAIGLQNGRPVPIVAGGRVSGRVGAWEVGALDMRTGADGGLPGENFAVLRARRELTAGSDVGVIFVDRTAVGGGSGDGAGDGPGGDGSVGSGAADNRSWGVDANLSLLGPLRVNAYWAGTDAPGAEGDRTAARLGAAWRDRNWNVSALWRRFGDGFDPGVGFVRRTGVEHLYGTVGILRSLPAVGIQEVQPWVEAERFDALQGGLVTRTLRAGVQVTLLSGASLTATATDRFERVDEPFPVGGEEVQPGGYDFREASLELQSSAGRPLSGSVTLAGGTFFSGERRSLGAAFRWLVSPRLAVQGSADYNRIDLPSGATNSSVWAGRIKYAFNTRAFAALNVQYNQITDEVVTFARFNVIHGPLSDLFLVLTERRRVGEGSAVLERAVTAKVTRLLTF
ncbi:MAG: DUF5916 domain-containing protein, partial [Longimicrobiales bacterium]|nr:DUF5916 domain-containing protein [Longimicrobiales bacterium]